MAQHCYIGQPPKKKKRSFIWLSFLFLDRRVWKPFELDSSRWPVKRKLSERVPSSYSPVNRPLSLPALKSWQRMKGKQMTECVCFLVVGNLPCSSGLFVPLFLCIYLFIKVVTLLHAKTLPAPGKGCPLLLAQRHCRGMPPPLSL